MSTLSSSKHQDGWGISVGTVSALVGAVALGVLIIAANAADPMMAAHSWLFFFLAVGGLLITGLWAGARNGRNPFDPAFYEDTIVKFGVAAAMFWGIAGFLVGRSSPCS